MPNGMKAPTRPIGSPDTIGWGPSAGFLSEQTESVPDLMWPASISTYARMRRDPKLRAILQAYFLPLIRATWAVDGEGVSKEEAVDLLAGDLGLPVLGKKGRPADSPIRGFKFSEHMRTALLSFVYGHMPTEKWFTTRGGRTHLAGWEERQPHTIALIDVADSGQIKDVTQNTQLQPIPASRFVWYVNEREGNNWTGVSLLRSCYTPWVLKHEVLRVHATSHRRWGMGVPVVHAPAGATPAQIEEARRLASGFRAGDQAGAGLPEGFSFEVAGMTGGTPDAVGFLRYLNEEMSGSALAAIIELGTTNYGSRALGDTFLDLFLLSLQAAADTIGDIATYGHPAAPGVSRALMDYNFGEDEACPRIVAKDVGDRHEITATAIQTLVASGAVQADDELEAFIREAWGLPGRKTPRQEPPGPGGAPGGTPAGAPPGRPGGPKPAGGGGAPATQPPPASQPQAPAGTPAGPGMFDPAAAGHQVTAAWRPDGLRRDLTDVEAAAGLDPWAIRGELETARDTVMSQWSPVLNAQRADLADQVAAAVDGSRLDRLAMMATGSGDGADVLYGVMRQLAAKAASRVIGEAAGQGVDIPADAVAIDEDRLRQIARARAAMAATYLATAASRRALQVATVPPAEVTASAGSRVGALVKAELMGLSTVSLAEELMAALHLAVNVGRVAVMAAGPGADYFASEVMDANTCAPCATIDGYQFSSLEEAQADYLNGAYVKCLGQLRCRGTVVARWRHDEPAPAGPYEEEALRGPLGQHLGPSSWREVGRWLGFGAAAEAEGPPPFPGDPAAAGWTELLHPRDRHGRFARKPGSVGPAAPGPGELDREDARQIGRELNKEWGKAAQLENYDVGQAVERAYRAFGTSHLQEAARQLDKAAELALSHGRTEDADRYRGLALRISLGTRYGLYRAIITETADADMAGLPGLAQHLRHAAGVVEAAPDDSAWRAAAAGYLRHAATEARQAAEMDRSQRYEDLARQVLNEPAEGGRPSLWAVTDFAGMAARAVPHVIGGGEEQWNGRIETFRPYDDPGIAGRMTWDGTMRLQDGYAARLERDLERAAGDPAGRAVLDDMDPYDVLFHELLHGLVGGHTQEQLTAREAARKDLAAGDIKVLAAFGILDDASADGGATPHAWPLSNVDFGRVPPATIDDLTRRGYLRQADFSNILPDGTAEHLWMLTPKGVAVGKDVRPETTADQARGYTDPAGKDVEEGFTELGSIMHIGDWAAATGIGDWETGILARRPPSPEARRLRADLAAALAKQVARPDAPGRARLEEAQAALKAGDLDKASRALWDAEMAQPPGATAVDRLAELIGKLRNAEREDRTIPDPAWARQRDQLLAVLRDARLTLRKEPGTHDVIAQIAVAIHDLEENSDAANAGNVTTNIARLGSPAAAKTAAKVRAEWEKLLAVPWAKHATLAEYADRLNDPQRIRDGKAWGHYPDKTARALDWVQAVARAERKRNTNVKGTPGWRRVIELADQINREGAAGKIPAMARQLLAVTGSQRYPGQVEAMIRQHWMDGGAEAFNATRKWLQPGWRPRPAAAAPADEEPPLPPPAATLAGPGAEAARLADWAWEDPPARLADARAQVDDLARRHAEDETALREIRDVGTMLARLAEALEITARANPAPDAAAAGWDEHQHPRDSRGRFAHIPGGTKPAPAPGRARPADVIINRVAADLGGEADSADSAGHGDTAERLRFAIGALHVGNDHLAGTYITGAAELARKHGNLAQADRIAELRRRLAGPAPRRAPAGQPPPNPRRREPQAPPIEDVLASVAPRYNIMRNVTDEQKQHVAAAFAGLPPDMRAYLKDGDLIRFVQIRDRNWKTRTAEEPDPIEVQGCYFSTARHLDISARSDDVAGTTIHEVLHAEDRHVPSGRYGRRSNQAGFKKITRRIRAESAIDPHYVPAPDAPPWLIRCGNQEMYAELGSDYLLGRPYALSSRALPRRLWPVLDDYFTGIYGQPRGYIAAAAGEPDQPVEAEVSCVRTVRPDGTPGLLWVDAQGREIDPATGETLGPVTGLGPPEDTPPD